LRLEFGPGRWHSREERSASWRGRSRALSFLFFVAVYSVPTLDAVTNIVGLGGIAIGLIPLLLNRSRSEAGALR